MDMDMASGEMPAGEHVHDHSAHASAEAMPAMNHDHGAVGRRADGSYYYTHGAFTGHIVPGTFFLLWGTWWLIATHYYFLRSSGPRQNFTTRAWQKLWFGSAKLRGFPLEPVVKIILPAFGILGELWLGHGPAYMALHASDGKFDVGNLNDWQHSAMYSAFITSGVVDLLGHKLGLPTNTELGFLSLAFLSEGLLLGFHLKGPDIEWLLHFILVLQIFATVLSIFFEMAFSSNIIIASLRPILTIIQGIWWIQTAYFMYTGMPEWDPEYMGSGMFIPVILVMDLLLISVTALALFLVLRWVVAKFPDSGSSSYVAFSPLKSTDNGSGNGNGLRNGDAVYTLDDEERGGAVLELSPLSLSDDDRKFGRK